MSERFEHLEADHIRFIEAQQMFFVGTAAPEGFVNVSPKGMDSLRVLSPNRIVWLNLTGSGNESAAHVLENERMTLMFCSFDKLPLILRVYGRATAIHPRDEGWNEAYALFPAQSGARQCFDLAIDLVQTSCGYAVPQYTFDNHRRTLAMWADKRGPDGIAAYWEEKNQKSLDGKPTRILG